MTRRTRESDHVVICGWNKQGERIVEELEKADPCPGLVILAELSQRPVPNEDVDFVCGDPTQDQDLRRAGVEQAQSVIILTDFSSNPNEADGRALLIALAVETLNPHTRTCVQVLNHTNRRHFERADVDEIICLDQIGGNLAVASALNPGLSHVVSELLTFNSGSEFYRVAGKVVQELAGYTYTEAAQRLAERHAALIGVETDDSAELREKLSSDVVHATKTATSRVIVVNPQSEYRIQGADAFYCVAEATKTW
ncbi:MAG: NAD(P)-binding protein [Candidatus Bipolaricaulia bacterium]